MNRDGLYIELRNLEEELQGISPKLALYASIKKRIEVLHNEIGLNDVPKEMHRQSSVMNSIGGTRITTGVYERVRKEKKHLPMCVHVRRKYKCDVPSCNKGPTAAGRCKRCHMQTYKNYCRDHNASDMPKKKYEKARS